MTPLERLEQEADAFAGKGSAISIDRTAGRTKVTVWDARGFAVAEVMERQKNYAVQAMRRKLAELRKEKRA